MQKHYRVLIGIIALLGALLSCFTGFYAGEDMPSDGLPMYCLGAFCLTVFVACFFQKWSRVATRIIGFSILGCYVYYVISTRNQPDNLRAIQGLIVIGIPCGILGITGRFPVWALGGEAFNSAEDHAEENSKRN